MSFQQQYDRKIDMEKAKLLEAKDKVIEKDKMIEKLTRELEIYKAKHSEQVIMDVKPMDQALPIARLGRI